MNRDTAYYVAKNMVAQCPYNADTGVSQFIKKGVV